ncbi:hypothetical protein FRC11_004332 [Ceratobasidium sp. 423]|nr:hypothetical protein FRC11_004332 [Ceratobasidium sp. 423]
MKAVAVIVALFGLAVAVPLSGTPTGEHTGRPTGTGAPGHHGHHGGHPPFPAFTGGDHSFTGAHPSFTGVRPSFTGVPQSGDPRPTGFPSNSIAARDVPVQPSGSFSELRPEHSGSFTGRRPEHTGSFTGRPEHTGSFTGRRPEHTGAPHSLSGMPSRPTGSIIRADLALITA